MKNQVSISEVREAIRMAKGITPIMNDVEYLQLMVFYSSVLSRYEKEEYPNGLPEEDGV